MSSVKCGPLSTIVFAILSLACDGSSQVANDSISTGNAGVLSGPYLGQEPPGLEPQIFAPGFISTGLAERDVAMTPTGDELYFTAVLGAGFNFSAIVVTRLIDGHWTEPQVAPFSGRFKDLEPAISPDGETFLFVSNRPLSGSSGLQENEDIWQMKRKPDGWGAPSPLGEPINTSAAEFFPSIARSGTVYFTRRSEDRTESIYRSSLVDGIYQPPEKLGPEVNSAPTQFNAFIDPDERFIIVCSWGREDSLGGVDYYASFSSEEGVWSGPFNLGTAINTAEGQEWSPFISPDGRYFFFMSSRSVLGDSSQADPRTFADIQRLHSLPMNGNSDIWWVDASIITALRPPEVQ